MTGVLEEEERTRTQRAREEDHVEMEAGVTVTPLQTEEHRE